MVNSVLCAVVAVLALGKQAEAFTVPSICSTGVSTSPFHQMAATCNSLSSRTAAVACKSTFADGLGDSGSSGLDPFSNSLLSSTSDVLAELEELDSVLNDEKNDIDLEPRQPYLNRLACQAAKRRWQRHENDNGSSEVQIAMKTERILYITSHMVKNKHDYHSLRGLQALVQARKKQLAYLARENKAKSIEIAQALGIRFRPKPRRLGRAEKYFEFKNTHSKVGKEIRVRIQNREQEALAVAAAAAAQAS